MPITGGNYFLFFLFLMIKTMIVMMAAIAKTVTPIANNGLPVTIMAVGPSAPPIIPTEWAFSVEHPLSSITVANMNILTFFISPPLPNINDLRLQYGTKRSKNNPSLPHLGLMHPRRFCLLDREFLLLKLYSKRAPLLIIFSRIADPSISRAAFPASHAMAAPIPAASPKARQTG